MSQVQHTLTNKNSLLNTSLNGIQIYKKNTILCVKLSFGNFRSSSDYKNIDLIFEEVFEYNFYHNNDHIFYNVEDFKLFQNEKEAYISLDPDTQNIQKSVEDNDFVRAKKVSLINVVKR